MRSSIPSWRVCRALVMVILLGALAPAWAQLSTAPSAQCHVTDGSFTACPNSAKEWSDVTPVSFPSTNSYLYVNQDPTHTNLYLMYDFPLRVNPLGATDSVHINFFTVETVSGAPKLIDYDIFIYGNGQVQILQQGKPTPPGNIVAAAGFGTSPNSSTAHVTAELQVPLVAGPPSTYSSDPLFWNTSLPPTPTPPPDPPSCVTSVLSVCVKTQDQIDAWTQESDAAYAEGEALYTAGLVACDQLGQQAQASSAAFAQASLNQAAALFNQQLQAIQASASQLKRAAQFIQNSPKTAQTILAAAAALQNYAESGPIPINDPETYVTVSLAGIVAAQKIAQGALVAARAVALSPEVAGVLATAAVAFDAGVALEAAVAVAVAQVAQAAATDGCLVALAAITAPDFAKAAAYELLAEDPPDPDYTVIAVPGAPAQPLVTTASGFSPQVVSDLNALIANAEQEIALLQVIPVSVNRVAGAVAAGNAFWQGQQANAVQTYASRLIALINNEASLKSSLASDLSASGLVFTFSSDTVYNLLLGPLLQNGLPAGLSTALTQLQTSSPTQADILSFLSSASAQTAAALGTGVFPQALTDPSLNVAANGAVKALATLGAVTPSTALTPSFNFTVAGDYTTAGVGLRGVAGASLALSTVPAGATVQKALLYWGMLDNGEDASLNKLTFNGQPIVGSRIGTGPDTCWGRTNSFTYRADVTSLVAGNGTYPLSNVAFGGNILAEGASLIVVYQLPGAPVKTVIIDDGNLSLPSGTPTGTASFTFNAAAPVQATTTFNVGDGQIAGTPVSFSGDAGTITFPNLFTSRDGPLWDTSTFNVSSVIAAGADSGSATISVTADCLLWSAQAFSVTSTVAPTPITTTAGFVVATPAGGTVINAAGLGTNDAPTVSQQLGKIVQFRTIQNPLVSPATLASQLTTGLVNDGVLNSSQAATVLQSVLKTVVTPLSSSPQACDVNGDGVIDKRDIALITSVLNTPAAGATDTRDANKDGIINALDARVCTTKCTTAGCAIN